MTELNIFKVEYYWYEGEHKEVLLVKDVQSAEFENDLSEAKAFAEKLKGIEIQEGEYLGKGYRIECLPEFFEQIIWFLIDKKEYKECYFDKDVSYVLDDDSCKEITVTKNERITKRVKINCQAHN